jgi:hypothetical protein
MTYSNSKSRFHVKVREHANNWISGMPKSWAIVRVRNSRRRETRRLEKIENMENQSHD